MTTDHAAPPLRGRWIAMTALLIAGFMNLIDVTIVNVALPSMQADFAATDSQIEWVVAVYILTFALLLLPMGRLGDVVGRRLMFVAGVIVFTIGSALCGLAPSIGGLVAARIVQGIGGAMMTPQTLAIVPVLFQPQERGLAYALFGLTAGLAAVTGPVAGGLLIGADIWALEWRPIFLVNVPIGVLAVVAALRFVPHVPGGAGIRIDVAGIVLAATALLLVLFPLIEGRQLGWPWWCFALMILALPVAAAFVLWQLRQSARGGAQLLPATLLANRTYLLGTGIVMLIFAGIPGFFLVLAITLQVGNGLTPLQSGLTTIPFSLGVLVASILSGRLGLRFPRGRISLGAALLATGMFTLRFALPGAGEVFDSAALRLPLVIAGLGLGTAVSPLFQTVLANVAGQDAGSASGALQSFQQVGGALGVAIMGEVFFSTLRLRLPASTDPVATYSDALTLALGVSTVTFLVVAALIWRLPIPRLAPVR